MCLLNTDSENSLQIIEWLCIHDLNVLVMRLGKKSELCFFFRVRCYFYHMYWNFWLPTLQVGCLHLWYAIMWLHDAACQLGVMSASYLFGCVTMQCRSSQKPTVHPWHHRVAVAQSLEHLTRSWRVVGSNPIWNSDFFPSSMLVLSYWNLGSLELSDTSLIMQSWILKNFHASRVWWFKLSIICCHHFV